MASVSNLEKELREIKTQLEKLKDSCKSADDLQPLQDKLRTIDSKKVDGKWVSL